MSPKRAERLKGELAAPIRKRSARKTAAPATAAVLHPHQQPPVTDPAWSTWLLLAGRGAGKTFAGASWIADHAEADPAARGPLPAAPFDKEIVAVDPPSARRPTVKRRAAGRPDQKMFDGLRRVELGACGSGRAGPNRAWVVASPACMKEPGRGGIEAPIYTPRRRVKCVVCLHLASFSWPLARNRAAQSASRRPRVPQMEV
jgi:hypothetical protein